MVSGNAERDASAGLAAGRLAAMMAASPEGLLIVDGDRRVLDVNERFCRMTGVPRERAVGAVPPYPWWPPDAYAHFEAALDRITNGGEGEFQGEILGPDGERVPIEGRWSSVADGPPGLSEHIVSVRDVSARRRVEARLQDSEARLLAVFGSMGDGVIVQGADGRVLMANPAACRIVGLPLERLLASTPSDPRWETVRPDGTPFPFEAHPSMVALATGVPQRDVIMGITSADTGEQRWIRINSDPLEVRGASEAAVLSTFVDLTDTYMREAEIRRQRDFTDLVLRGMGDALLILGPDRRVRMVNDRFCALTGFARERVLGVGPPFPWWPPEQVETLLEQHRNFDGRDTGPVEMTIMDVRGDPIPVEVTRAMTAGADGTPELLVLTGRDIRERKAAQQALGESEGRFRAAVTATRDGMIIVGPDAVVRSCNPAAGALLGIAEDELVGAEMAGLGHVVLDERGATLAHAQRPVVRTLATGHVQRGVTVGITRPDGRLVWAIESCEPLGERDEHGRPEGALITLTDITHLQETQAALRASEARFRALFGYHADAVIRLSVTGRVMSSSPSVWRVLRYDPDTLPTDLTDLVHPQDLPDMSDAFDRMAAGEVGVRVQARLHRGDGRWIRAEVTGGPVFDDDGRMVELQYNVRDVTEREERERESGALHRIAEVVAAGAIAAVVFASVARELAEIADAELAAVTRFEGMVGHLEGHHRTGEGPDDPRLRWPLDLEEGGTAIALVRETQRPAAVREVGARAANDAAAAGRYPTPYMTVAVPVRVDGEVWGALSVDALNAAFPEGTVERMMRFADLASIAIASIRDRAQLQREATTDALTGLANRRAFDRRLTADLRDDRTRICLACFDIDGFKRINDLHGHAAGDHVLRCVATAVEALAGPHEMVARLGGDEFAWIMRAGIDVAHRRAQQLLEVVRSVECGLPEGLSASVGVATARPAESTDALLVRADGALYRAKKSGGNGVRAAD